MKEADEIVAKTEDILEELYRLSIAGKITWTLATKDALEKLDELSMEGKISWSPTRRQPTFLTVFGDYTALISVAEENLQCDLRLLDRFKNELSRLSSSTWDKLETYPRLNQLYESARREALNVGAELDNILVELRQF